MSSKQALPPKLVKAYQQLEKARTRVALLEAELLPNKQRQRPISPPFNDTDYYYTLLEQASDGIFLADETGQLILVNNRVSQLLGYSRDELLAQSVSYFVAPEDLAVLPIRFEELRKGSSVLTPRILIRKDGSRIQVEINAKMLPDGMFQGIIHDLTERKYIEAALQASQEMYQRIVETAQEGIWLINADMVTTFVNRKLCEILGFTASEIIGKPLFDILDDEARWRVAQGIEQRRKGIIEQYEIRFQRKDGVYRWASVSSSPIVDEKGQYTGAVALISDITERKLAEQALQDSEERFRTVIESAPLGVGISVDGIVKYGNPKYLQMFGYTSSDEIIGHSLVEQIAPQSRAEIVERVRRREAGEEVPSEYETIGFRPDGTQFPFTVWITRVHFAAGPANVSFFLDLTERKFAEKALRESEVRFRSTFEQAAVGVALVLPDGHFLLVNQRFCDLVGYNRDEMLTKTFHDITHPDDLHNDVENVRRIFAREIDTFSVEKRYICKDQTIQWVQLTSAITWNDDNTPKYFISVVQDIAGRKRAEEEEVLRINRTLSVISGVNQAIVRIRDLKNLYETACQIAVDKGGFRMAWIGQFDTQTSQVKPLAWAGVGEDYITHLDITLNDEPRGYGPTATVLRTGQHVIVQDIESDLRMTPWRDDAIRLGYRASAGFPLKVEGETRGVLNLYATQPDFFTDHEIALLNEMAEDISFAMDYAEQEKERKLAANKLREAERFARSTVNALSAHIAILDEHGMVLSVNDAWRRFGQKMENQRPSAIEGENYLKRLEAISSGADDSETAKALLAGIHRVIDGELELFSYELPYHSPDEKRWFMCRITRFAGEGPTRVVIAYENVTERVLISQFLAEEKYQLTERMKELNCLYSHAKLMEQPNISLDELCQETIDLLPAAWQYPNITCVRLTLEGRSYTTSNFDETTWRMASDVHVGTKLIGLLEVYYLEAKPIEAEGPFLKEERLLIDELARRLGHKVETLHAAAALQQAYDTLEAKVISRTAQLQVAKERVEAILNNSVDGILLMDHNFAIQQTNTAFERLFTCQPDAYFNQPLTNLLSSEANELTISSIQKLLAEKRDSYITVCARRSDGTLFDAELGVGQINNQGVVCVIRDITERKQSQIALEKRNLTLTALHTGALEIGSELDIQVLLPRIVRRAVDLLNAQRGGCIYLYDADKNVLKLEAATGIFENRVGVIHSVNEGVSGHVLVSGQPLIVNDYTRWSSPSSVLLPDPPSAVMGVPLIIQGQAMGVLLVDANSQERTFAPEDVRLAEMFAAQAAATLHNAELYSAAQREITERKNAEKALAEERNLLRTVIDTVPDLIYLSDTQSRIILNNVANARAWGYDNPLDNVGKTPADVFSPELATRFMANDRRIVETETPLINFEGRTLAPDRSEVWSLTTKVPFYSVDGELRGIAGVTRDITVQKQAEEALKQALTKEKELGELKTRFISMASHEFRTPLATILAMTESLSFLRHKLSEDQIQTKLNNIRGQVEHLKDIMEDVLLLARMEARRVEFNPVIGNLHNLCQEVIEDFQSRPDVHHSIEYSCDQTTVESALDVKLMRQIISNLISNAIKYSPEEQSIQLILHYEDAACELVVRDHGIGIPEADLKHLFEPFHRAANVGTISGTGLGLVIVKDSVELHGGIVAVESTVGAGTTFTIRIPISTSGEK